MQSSATPSRFPTLRAWLAARDWPRAVRWLSIATAAVIFLVHVMGALVTDTGSQAGCANSWPLCKGQFIPAEFTRSTLIEFQHRLGVPLVTLLMVALIVGALALWRDRLEIKILAPLMFVTLLGQALLGALAVMYPTSAVILAFHFGVSSLSVASVIVTAFFIHGFDRWDRLRDRVAARGFRWLVWVTTAYTYVVIYLGAYVLHTNAQLACTAWPICDARRPLPPLSVEPSVINMTHRVAAGALVLLVIWLFVRARRLRRVRPDFYWASAAALVLILAQALEGATVVFSRASVWAEVMHSAFIALFFSVMCVMVVQTIRRPASARNAPPAQSKSKSAPRPSRNATAAIGGR
ncbi:MAG TPA: COX15/CtaA family protein [Ktedonobacterales bacterium]